MIRRTTRSAGVLFTLALLASATLLSNRAAWSADTAPPPADATPLVIDCEFPGGNIVVERIEGDRVYLHQDQRDTREFWFYWYFRVQGAAGRTLSFHFTKGNVLAARGPAVSVDGGQTWQWLGKEATEGASFRYTFADAAGDVRFSLAMPYTEANLARFLKAYANSSGLRVEKHAVSRKGRTVERLHFGRLDGKAHYRVLISCRHHACEMMASYTLEGIIDTVLGDDEDGRWLRNHVEFAAVPFMDKDGVEDGDQGKNRHPHDHNRDYEGESIYPEVAAMREFAPRWSQGRLKMALDLHCPWIRGSVDGPGTNEHVFMVGHSSPKIVERQQVFGKMLEEVRSGPLPFSMRHTIPFGQSWNTTPGNRSFSRWAATIPNTDLAASFEVPYANAGGVAVTAESAHAFGVDLARAIRRYLETEVK